MDNTNFQNLVMRWQNELNLRDWKITSSLVSASGIYPKSNITPNSLTKLAKMEVADTTDEDIEKTIIKLLLHLTFPFNFDHTTIAETVDKVGDVLYANTR